MNSNKEHISFSDLKGKWSIILKSWGTESNQYSILSDYSSCGSVNVYKDDCDILSRNNSFEHWLETHSERAYLESYTIPEVCSKLYEFLHKIYFVYDKNSIYHAGRRWTAEQGPQGPRGLIGERGTKGDTGPQGPKGGTGATGPQGPKGTDGTNGTNGKNGSQGPRGPQGVQGPKGTDGKDGGTGATGPQGPKGTDGTNGTNGKNGSQGPQGPTGPSFTITSSTATNYLVGKSTNTAETSDVSTWYVSSVYAKAGILYATDFIASSDIKFKKNISAISSNEFDKLSKVQFKSFDWKSDDKHSFGVIAQELESLFPELVHNESDGKHVAYLPLLCAYCAYLKREVELLKKQ